MFDETQAKIIQATMNLVMEKGYSSTTTKDIALHAGINECTIFRKFHGKKDIVLSAMQLPEWNPGLEESDFTWCGDPESDLVSFAETYMRHVTPRMVKVFIGLRTPELYPDTAEGILKVPCVFKAVLLRYFQSMLVKGNIRNTDCESMSMAFLSMCFGFVFFRASFGEKLSALPEKQYISESVRIFLKGIG